MHSLLEALNPEQRDAVESTEGPLLILAGAGSGKTRVITHRIAWLVNEKGVAPGSILAVTFTNKAAGEMAERVNRLLESTSPSVPTGRWGGKPQISTFHSLCVRILRRDVEALRVNGQGLTRDFTIFDENDQQGVVKQIMKRMGIDTKQLTPRNVLSRISSAKNRMVDPESYFLESKDPTSERVAHIFKAYQAELSKNNAMDFDDLLLEALHLLKASGEVREKYQRRYRYLLVDEYQDTNRPQYEMMKLLAGEAQNVCAVGDEDQSIYSWRGADINNILNFEKDFSRAKIIRLEQNYRSTQTILEAAGAVVANNLQRKGKKLWTERQGGSLVGYYEAPDGENEALFIANKVLTFLRNTADDPDQHCAVLYRTNAQSRLVEEALRRFNVTYTMVGGFSFYERSEIKDMIAYLRLVRNPHDSMAFQRVVNTPARGIGKTTLENLERLALETGKSTWEILPRALADRLVPTRASLALENFRQLILDAQAMMDPDFAGKLSADLAEAAASEADTDFDFGATETSAPEAKLQPALDFESDPEEIANDKEKDTSAFRSPGDAATLPELIRFIIDRSGYIKALETEGSPESYSRIENLKELANAAHDAEQRGETLAEFLDHAALASDTDKIDPDARVTLMTLHAAKGLEFSLVFLTGFEEGLFPHSRTLSSPNELEEERRLCYVGMTRAMNTLILTRAFYRRRYGADTPEASVPSRFLEEVPPQLIENLGSPTPAWSASTYSSYGANRPRSGNGANKPFYNYEDESQEIASADAPHKNAKPFVAPWMTLSHENYRPAHAASPKPQRTTAAKTKVPETPNSIDNITRFFGGHPGALARPVHGAHVPNGEDMSEENVVIVAPNGNALPPVSMLNPGESAHCEAAATPRLVPMRLKKGQHVLHAKYGEGTILAREGEGDNVKLTVLFARHGMKKLIEKFANLQRL